MKTLKFSFLSLFLFSHLLYSQEGGGGNSIVWYPYEIFMLTKGLPPGVTVQYKLETPGSVWDTNDIWPPQGYFLTHEYDEAFFPLTGTVGNLPSGWNQADVHGFDFVNTGEDNDYYAYGLYKMTVTTGSAYFYLDYRDTRYRYYGSTINWNEHHPQDLWIMYDGATDIFYYHSNAPLDLNPITGGWTQINDGDYLPIWEIKEQSSYGSPQTDQFEDYWDNALCVVEQNQHPLLVWGSFPLTSGVHRYNIYRKKTGEPNFIRIHQTSSGTITHYLDMEIITGLPQANEISVYYYVTAEYTPSDVLIESGPTNTVEIRTPGPSYEKIAGGKGRDSNPDFILEPNYPNPFNPRTTIRFSLAKKAFVSIKVYDPGGKEIAALVNAIKEIGTYEIVFDARNLPGGVYFYRMQVGEYSAARKLTLIR